MRDTLPTRINNYESGIVNLDNIRNAGTHWVCYKKRGPKVTYFDSFGNLRPPKELVRYLKSDGKETIIKYNLDRKQEFDSVVCGHLCLKFLICSA